MRPSPALAAALVVLSSALPAMAQQYTISASESGANPTSYTKPYNWRIWTGTYHHTTMLASSADPKACQESPCLDDGKPGDRGPDSTRGGTATAKLSGMMPGTYKIELRYRQSANRSTAVPWKLTSDAASDNVAEGELNERDTAPDKDGWVVLGGTDKKPIRVLSSVTSLFGSDTKKFSGSLSYNGFRLTRVEEPPPMDAGVDADAGGVDAAVQDAGETDAASESAVEDAEAVAPDMGGLDEPPPLGTGDDVADAEGFEGGCRHSARTSTTGGVAFGLLAVLLAVRERRRRWERRGRNDRTKDG